MSISSWSWLEPPSICDRYELGKQIEILKSRIESLSDDSPQKSDGFFEIATLYEQRSNKYLMRRSLLDLLDAIVYQEAGLKLLPDSDPTKPKQLFRLAKFHERRRPRPDIDAAIINLEAGLKLLPDSDPTKATELIRLANLHERRGSPPDIDAAIINLEAGLKLLPDSDPTKSTELFQLVNLHERRGLLPDIDAAIINQEAGLKLLPDSDPMKPTELFQLVNLHERRGLLPDIDAAIINQEAGLKLLPDSDFTKRTELFRLVELHKERFERREWLPNFVNMPTHIHQSVGSALLHDLQQFAEYIKKPTPDIDITDLMTEMIKLLNEFESGIDTICDYIRDHSVRLSTYCEALRSQVGRHQDEDELRALYEDIVATERKFSVAHKNLKQRYEKIYTLWKAKREQISNTLALLDSASSQTYIKGVRNQIQRVDESFEKIREMLEDQGRTLKDYFAASCKTLVASTNLKPNIPPEPGPGAVPPDNPNSVVSAPDPGHLPNAVEAGKQRLHQVGSVLGKARYTKTRRSVEKRLSISASQLNKLHRDSKQYASRVINLSSASKSSFVQTTWWTRWCAPSDQLMDLVKAMSDRLTGIQRGFDKYKNSMLGLIFRPLGDVIEELKPYCDLEVVASRLHPDMFLYEAAFRFLIDHVSQQCRLTELIDVPPPPIRHSSDASPTASGS